MTHYRGIFVYRGMTGGGDGSDLRSNMIKGASKKSDLISAAHTGQLQFLLLTIIYFIFIIVPSSVRTGSRARTSEEGCPAVE